MTTRRVDSPEDPVEPTRAELRAEITRLAAQHETDVILLDELRAELKIEIDKVENLEIALATARRIGTAIGILMDARRITEDQAFDLLRTASQHSRRKLRDIAEAVVETGELPPSSS